MKCIKCGREILPEFNNCPYCGQNLQIVPDYSIYDEEDIHVLMNERKDTSVKSQRTAAPSMEASVQKSRQMQEKTAKISSEQEARERKRAKIAEAKRKQRMKWTIVLVVCLCTALLIFAVILKISFDENKRHSYDYQKQQAQTAKSKGDLNKAEEYYLQALAAAVESEDKADARLSLAELYYSQNDTENAVKYFKDVLNYDTKNKTAYKKLFEIYAEAGNTEAILELRDSVTDASLMTIFTDYTVEAPKLGLDGGTYSEKLKLTISAKKDVEIYYTLDGSNPKTNGTLYSTSFEIKKEGMHTVKAVSKNSLGVYSSVVSETYVIKYNPPKDPVITQEGDYVVITVPENCSTYYVWSTGNVTPTIQDTLYVKRIEIPEGYNYLAVIVIDDETGLSSGVIREAFENIVESSEKNTTDESESDSTVEE